MPSEFELIDRFLVPFARSGGGVVVGPGDDCAVLRPRPRTELCVTTDAVVEGVHFDSSWFSNREIGHKALAVNLSDLAAMGAEPRWFLCSIACGPADLRRLPAIAAGMAALAAQSGVILAGGNFTRADTLSLHITAAGEVPTGRALKRSGASVGDRIYVTGTLGDAALALKLREQGRRVPAVFRRQLEPEPRLAAGIAARPYASAAIDLSDGLLQDLGHVARASGVGVSIDARLVPVSRSFTRLDADLELALSGGEDYELAIFVPPHRAAAFERAMAKAGHPITLIGEATRARGLTVRNAPNLRGREGHDHFRGRSAGHSSAVARAGGRRATAKR